MRAVCCGPDRRPASGRSWSASATSGTRRWSRPGATGSSSPRTSDLPGYDQDAFADALRHNELEAEELLTPFAALRAANVRLWGRATPEQRARVGLHRERGPESYELTFRMIAGHDRFHLNQARETLAAILAGGTTR